MHFKTIRTRLSRLTTYFALLSVGLVLTSCGGGGGSSGTVSSLVPGSYGSSKTFEASCAAPRTGTDPFNNNQPYPDKAGSLANEKSWLRAWIDETYLWNNEVGNIDAAPYNTAISYFNVLKTSATTASGRPKDEFHFVQDTAVWNAFTSSGAAGFGYGIEWIRFNSTPPNRRWVVAYTEEGSPAAVAGIQRGDELQSVDGADFVNGADTTTLNNGLIPAAANQTHTFTFKTVAGTTRNSSLVSANIVTVPVQNVKTISTASGNVGYLLFNDHIATAEGLLVKAVNQLKAAPITDLVIDMRYNGGGSIGIASELAFMVAGPTPTANKPFETYQCNSRNPFPDLCSKSFPFYSAAPGFYGLPANTALPSLGLNRVYILTSGGTASASESVINGLRGVGVKVNLIGSTTRGKPYGFFPTDNCGTTYFSIQFKGVNAIGFGDFADGFPPTCQIADDLSKPLGDATEGRLAAALSYRASNDSVCPAATTAVLGKTSASNDYATDLTVERAPYRQAKVMR